MAHKAAGFFAVLSKPYAMDDFCSMAKSLDDINATVRRKSEAAIGRMKSLQNSLGMKHGQNPDEGRLTSIRSTVKERDGVAERIRFKFKRSGVFVHKGVGRGTSMGQAGSTKRKAKEWFNPVIEALAEELASDVFNGFIEVKIDKLLIK